VVVRSCIGDNAGVGTAVSEQADPHHRPVQLNHVPYKGSAEAHTQILGGQIPFMFDAMPAVLGHIKGGKLRGIAVSTRSRSSFLPDSREDFGRFIRNEIAKWAKVAKDSGAKVD
jgi:tripartite-type tricarboxylate transporter receptor subunit TctC